MNFLAQLLEILKTIETKGESTIKMSQALSILSYQLHQSAQTSANAEQGEPHD